MKKISLLALLIAVANIAQGEETVDLGKTVVTSMGFETNLLDEPTNISVISKEKIEEKNYKTVIEALDDNPMINIVNSHNGTVIDMRGSGDSAMNNVKILVDGVAINPFNPTRKGLGLEAIPMSSIERIEISPGGGAVLYGNGVSGGVVNIITKSGGYSGGYIEADINSFNNKKFGAGGNYKLNDKLSFGINYSGRNNGEFRNTEKNASDYIDGNINYKFSDVHKASLSASRYVENETSTGSALQRDIIQNGVSLAEKYGLETLDKNRKAKGLTTTKRQITKENVTGKYEFTPTQDFSLVTTVYNTNMYNKSNTEGYSLSQNKKTGSYTIKETSSFGDYREETTGILLKATQKYDNGSLIVGLDNIRYKFTGRDDSNIYDYKKEIISPYILNKYNLTEKLEFTAGYRYEWSEYDITKDVIGKERLKNDYKMRNNSFESTLSYNYRDTGNVFVRFEKGYMSPTPGQRTESGDMLKAETSKSYEIGLKDYLGDSTFISASIFRLDKKDEITGYKIPNDNKKYFRNEAKTNRKGIEFTMENYLGNATLTSGFVYMEAVDEKNERLEEIPRFKANVSANYKFTPKFDATISYSYLGAKEGQGIMNSSHSLTDLSARYRVNDSLTLKAGINNIFDKEYYTLQNNSGLTANPGEERSYYFGFKMTF